MILPHTLLYSISFTSNICEVQPLPPTGLPHALTSVYCLQLVGHSWVVSLMLRLKTLCHLPPPHTGTDSLSMLVRMIGISLWTSLLRFLWAASLCSWVGHYVFCWTCPWITTGGRDSQVSSVGTLDVVVCAKIVVTSSSWPIARLRMAIELAIANCDILNERQYVAEL